MIMGRKPRSPEWHWIENQWSQWGLLFNDLRKILFQARVIWLGGAYLAETFDHPYDFFFKISDNFLMVCTYYPTCAASQSRRIDRNRMVKVFPNINAFPVHPRQDGRRGHRFLAFLQLMFWSVPSSLDSEMRLENSIVWSKAEYIRVVRCWFVPSAVPHRMGYCTVSEWCMYVHGWFPRTSKHAQLHKHRSDRTDDAWSCMQYQHASLACSINLNHQIISTDLGMYSRNRREDTGDS